MPNFKIIKAQLALIPFALLIMLLVAGLQKCNAQDSTEIKLNNYKQLFMNGTITSQEYETLRKQILGIKPQSISNETLESLQAKYTKKKRAGLGLLITGGGLMIIGSTLTALNFSNAGFEGSFIAGVSAMGASIPLFIAGGACFHKYGKYKRQWKEKKSEIAVGLGSVRVAF